MTNLNLKETYRAILKGMKIHEESYDTNTRSYKKDMWTALTEVTGDSKVGYTLYLFSHHWNDLQEDANQYGIGINSKAEIVDIPEPPKTEEMFYTMWDSKLEKWIVKESINYKEKNELYQKSAC